MSEYDEIALKFLRDSGTNLEVVFDSVVEGFPFEENDGLLRNKYTVKLSRNGKSYEFPFYDSHYDYIRSLRPTEYDILACLEKTEVGSFGKFIEEFGYVINDEKSYEQTRTAWTFCREQYEKLCDLFGDEWMEELCEIN